MIAFKVSIDGFPDHARIVAPSRAAARYRAWRQIRECGYRYTFLEFMRASRVWRAA